MQPNDAPDTTEWFVVCDLAWNPHERTNNCLRPVPVPPDGTEPTELCICCRREMGDTHDVLCYVYANNRALVRDAQGPVADG